MDMATGWSTCPTADGAAAEAYDMMRAQLGGAPHFLIAHGTCDYDGAALLGRLRQAAPEASIHGGTTCLGVMTREGFHSQGDRGVGLLGIVDAEGSYGVGLRPLGGDPAGAATQALDQALDRASRPGQVPAVVLISSAPGHEEAIIRAIEEHLGPDVPIVGGTAADNDMSGRWSQYGDDAVAGDGVSVAVLFPTAQVSHSFHSGYEPTSRRGQVTRADGRLLHQIGGRRAADVYNEWTDGLIAGSLSGGSLVPTASLTPLGTEVGHVRGVPYFRLSYPVEVVPDGSLLLFTEIDAGAEVVLMQGTPSGIATRAGRVSSAALAAAPFDASQASGALVLFCTGCMLAVRDRLDDAADGLAATLGSAPFLTAFTLGEQGCFIGGENRHGNLMIATLIFGPLPS